MSDSIRKLVLAAVCLAFGIVLPMAFHLFGDGAGRAFLPMHLPVLLCGILCGWRYGALCGALVPLASSMITGMPPLFPIGAAMVLELCAYGLLSGLLSRKYNALVSLIGAMLGGRIVSGIASAVFFGMAGMSYGFSVFLAGALLTVIPGIIIQLILIPTLVALLKRAKVVQ